MPLSCKLPEEASSGRSVAKHIRMSSLQQHLTNIANEEPERSPALIAIYLAFLPR